MSKAKALKNKLITIRVKMAWIVTKDLDKTVKGTISPMSVDVEIPALKYIILNHCPLTFLVGNPLYPCPNP